MCSNKDIQELHEIFREYYKKLYGIYPNESDNKGVAEDFEVFFKKNKEKLATTLKAFDIKLSDFMKKRKYYFNDSKNEIISMLEYFDNPIVKKIRLKKPVDYSEFMFDDDIKDKFNGAYKFGTALNSFMIKNTYKPSSYRENDDIQYDSGSDSYELMFGDLNEQIKFLSNDAKFAPYMASPILDIILLMQEILTYSLSTSFDESKDVIDKQIPEDGLHTLIEDLTLVRNRYKRFFDIIYNGEFGRYPDFRYEPLEDNDFWE